MKFRALTGSVLSRPVEAGMKVLLTRLQQSAVLAGCVFFGSGLSGSSLFGAGFLGAGLPAPAGPDAQRQYEVTTVTGMPHLEENLRYARTTEKRCLDLEDLSQEFWMLRDVSLQDCRLVKTGQSAEEADYVLTCQGGHGTTGKANWRLGPGAIRGSLDVRLGGKNMTFYQRITATPAGTCG